MINDPIQKLLMDADQSAAPPRVAPGLAEHVRATARRRQRNARIVYASAAVLAIAFIIGRVGFSPRGSSAPSNTVQQQIAVTADHPSITPETTQSAAADINAHLQRIDEALARLAEEIRQQKLENDLAAMREPIEKVQQQREQAALILVFYADKKFNELNLKDSAIADYKQVIAVFPDTTWAEKAREKLQKIQTSGEQL
jgi:hypothetical protein